MSYFREICFLRCLPTCCFCFPRYIKSNLAKDRLKLYNDYECIEEKKASMSIIKFCLIAFTCFSAYRQLVDFYLDVFILWLVYQANVAADEKRIAENDYQAVLIVSFMSLASTFMITQSGIISILFNQGRLE